MSIGVRGNRAARSGRKRQGRPTKERILEAAAELFARRGFPGVSIRDITRTVGIKESSLYNHFRHKEALLEAVLDRMESEFAARAAAEEALRSRIGATTAERFMRARSAAATIPRVDGTSRMCSEMASLVENNASLLAATA